MNVCECNIVLHAIQFERYPATTTAPAPAIDDEMKKRNDNRPFEWAIL